MRKIKSTPKVYNEFPYIRHWVDEPVSQRLLDHLRESGEETLNRSEASIDDVACAIVREICFADYWEARYDLEGQDNYKAKLRKIMGKHYNGEENLPFEYYACHWLWSVGEIYAKKGKNLRFSESDILEHIKEKYGIKEMRHPYFSKSVKYVVNL